MDDEVFNCELLEMYLDLLGHEAVVAFSGTAALACLDASIDLVLMDVNMPEMTGFETTAAIRANEAYGDVPIIMVTALNSQEDRLEAVRVGASDYISKPVDEVELRVRVEAQLKVKQAQDVLKHHQEKLESLVQERTRQLETQNRDLEASQGEIAAMNRILEHAVEGISLLDDTGSFIRVNTAFATLFGYMPEQLAGMRWEQLFEAADQKAYKAAQQQMRARGKAELEAQGVHQNGVPVFMQAVLVPTSAESEPAGGYYCFVKDISERKAFEAKITYQTFHDALTGLANRPCFINRLEYALTQRRRSPCPLAVLFLDLDKFKIINDTLGHEAGDQLLITVAQRLKECVSFEDTVVRLGGDEFALLLETVETVEDAIQAAQQLLEKLLPPVVIQGKVMSVSVSIGIAYIGASSSDSDDLLRDAELAMYHAKMQGKSSYAVFNKAFHDTLCERLEIESELRIAVDRKQLRVYYQPLVNLETGQVTGVEALVRWEHPLQGLLLPGKFISIAEETGLIIPIGYWVLEEACRQAKEWEVLYPQKPLFTMSVNMSGYQLQQADVVKRVRDILEQTGLSPSKLKLEITETVLMSDMENAIQTMHALKALGVKLALDDFGTGYSSISNLHAFPLNTVKIDQSFVQRLNQHADAASIVGTIIALARSLNMDVTGEGVETEEHVAHLQGMGCTLGQGYFFSRPIAPQELGKMLPEASTPFLLSDPNYDKAAIEQYLWSLQIQEDEKKAA